MSGVDNTARRKWNREEFEEKARERARQADGSDEERKPKRGSSPPVQRAPLKQRDFAVDLSSKLGKTQVVTHLTPLAQQAGYYCNVCECVVKDSANYLDHINGKKHQRALGMSMRVERSSLEQVQGRFEMLKRKQQEEKMKVNPAADWEARISRLQDEEEERKRAKKQKKKDKDKQVEADVTVPEMDPEMAAMMGFGGFGTSKKS
eukprot:jgi/Chlat1/8801/Chrsp90S08140